jgi:U3 small nucleolar RNA-associated protein 24
VVANLFVNRSPQVPSSLFFQYNTALVPPYSILVDTNFLFHTVQHKLEIIPTMMDCLFAKCIPVITDCVVAELEKLQRYRLALRIAKDPQFERLKCDHKGTYTDDCLVTRVIKNRIYIVATNDRNLKRRIRSVTTQ